MTSDPQSQLRDDATAYCRKYWEYLAAAAWAGFVRSGRGVLFIQPDDRPEVGFTFLEAAHLSEATLKDDHLVEMLGSYNPETEIVFFFTTTDGAVAGRIGNNALPPPEAHHLVFGCAGERPS
jgi:hypothetical protein